MYASRDGAMGSCVLFNPEIAGSNPGSAIFLFIFLFIFFLHSNVPFSYYEHFYYLIVNVNKSRTNAGNVSLNKMCMALWLQTFAVYCYCY
jgi:hypothetical protein